MIFRGSNSWSFGPYEARQVVLWIAPLAAYIATNYGAELVGLLKEHGLTRAGLSAVAVLVLRGVYLYWKNNTGKAVDAL